MALTASARSVPAAKSSKETRPPRPASIPACDPPSFCYQGQLARDTEKRQSERRSLSCPVVLVTEVIGESEHPRDIPGDCTNIGNGGLYATVPIGYGVAIGQRYTFELTIRERGPEPGARQTVSQQGEIVRVELLLGEDGYAERIGVGVRLTGPRSGLIPMPMSA
jgi:hypothetical protein